MPRMLGRYETPGCCPGTRKGWRWRKRHGYGPDCPGAVSDVRKRKRAEQRQFERELRPQGLQWHPDELAFDIYDCEHGCNGDCEEQGSEKCTFVCHELLYVLGLR